MAAVQAGTTGRYTHSYSHSSGHEWGAVRERQRQAARARAQAQHQHTRTANDSVVREGEGVKEKREEMKI